MPLSRVCRTLKIWKHGFLQEHEERVADDNMHRRKSVTIAREEALGEILGEFYELDPFSQIDSVIDTCKKIGNIGKMLSKTKEFAQAETVTLETDL